jgi:hypothetical protein
MRIRSGKGDASWRAKKRRTRAIAEADILMDAEKRPIRVLIERS